MAKHGHVDGPACKRTLTRAELLATTAAPDNAKNVLASGLLLTASLLSPASTSPAQHYAHHGQEHQLAPPTDLVIALQHFVI